LPYSWPIARHSKGADESDSVRRVNGVIGEA